MTSFSSRLPVHLKVLAHIPLFVLFLCFPVHVSAQTSGSNKNISSETLKKRSVSKIKRWQYLASTGDREAQFRLGLYYDSIDPIPDNYQRSIYWYEAAASQGHTLAQYNLGVKFMTGEGVAKDQDKALSLWLQAANAGHMHAQFNVGRAYFLGVGLDENHRKAKFWFEKAAQQGDSKSLDLLAKLGWSQSAKTLENQSISQNNQRLLSPATSVKESVVPAKKNVVKKAEADIGKGPSSDAPIDIYTGPNSHNRLMTKVPNRQGLSVVAIRGNNWLKVSRKSGFPVWVHQDFVAFTNPAKTQGTITEEAVRARGLPKTVSGTIIGFFQKGESVSILEKKGEWYRVLASSNFSAWVKRKDWLQGDSRNG